MQLTVTGHHIDVTEALRNYVDKRLARLERHFDHMAQMRPDVLDKLDLDQTVEGVDLVRGVVVDRAQALERSRGFVQATYIEGQLGELEHCQCVLRLCLGDRVGGIEGVLGPARAPVDRRDRP